MPKNEDGEFELILGNRQLLSVFFIVVVLLGVFFTMGYIVGRNSAPLGADTTTARTSKPVTVDPPASEPPAAAPASREETRGIASQQPSSASEPERPEPRPEPARVETPRSDPPRAVKSAVTSSEPGAGQSYLQLAATSKREADIMVDVLREKGFKAMAAEIPEKRGTFRVLVGPVTDGTANKTRADLQSGGFPGNAAIRRNF